jgi:predicted phage terminase large subunit-like protein
MAWLDNRWLSAAERAEYIAIYTEYLDAIDEQYGDDLPAGILATYFEKSAEYERLRRIDRCEGNLLEFALEYFSEAHNPGNDGNWEGFDITDASQAPAFHSEITDIMNDVSNVTKNAKIAVAAPRGHAKSTYLSKAFPLHELVYRRRKYVIMISETPKVAKANLDWVRDQVKYNKKLREDFGALLSPKDQANIQDNSEGFIAWLPEGDHKRQIALLESASVGGAIRGRNWNGSRPDLIICDDLEDARPGGNASTPEQRQSLRDWFTQSVIPLGDPKGERTATVMMGTTVHADSLLMQVLYKRSDFKTKVYRAIIEQPERADLWEQCRQIYTDRENENRLADAIAFYKEHEAEMLSGSAVLWQEGKPLWILMTWKWDNGSKAFNTEYMNNPIDEESMIFNPETFTYWDDTNRDRKFEHKSYTISLGIDFAMGKQRGDFSALTVVARHREKGGVYIIDSYIERVKPDKYIEVIVDKVKHWQPDVIAAEAQASQEFFVDTLTERLRAEGYPANTRVKKIHQRSRKQLRIEAMLPEIENGTIRFSKRHALLLEQFERYGQGAHDDGPDSLEMAIAASKTRSNVVATVNKRTR